jgi:BirA family transcriptional regulator, biotin operon repressor / biotin---[acetyl-CoA-carboxylase] ligase
MDQNQLEQALAALPLGAIRYFATTGSTNEQAGRWAEAGAGHLSLVAAGEQSAGRGRLGRTWLSPAGASLAFSLVLREVSAQPQVISRLSGLGALAVSDAFQKLYAVNGQIKWPNDVLVERRKVCGILPETVWSGSQLLAVILGIGINVGAEVLQEKALADPDRLVFPVTTLETVLGNKPDPLALLKAVLESLVGWLPRLAEPGFLQTWQERLAFQDEWIFITQPENKPELEGRIAGLDESGSLEIVTRSGEKVLVRAGDVRLRPAGEDPS